MQTAKSKKKGWARTFYDVGIVFKGLNGILEFLGGLLLFFVNSNWLSDVIVRTAHAELMQDPSDFLGTHLLQIAQSLTVTAKTFTALYLFIHGVVKLIIVAQVWYHQRRALIWALWILGTCILLQSIQVVRAESLLLGILTLIDFLILLVIWGDIRKN
jgi:uncharacterized membrane protein